MDEAVSLYYTGDSHWREWNETHDLARLPLASLLLARATDGGLPRRPADPGWHDLETAAALAPGLASSPALGDQDRAQGSGLLADATTLLTNGPVAAYDAVHQAWLVQPDDLALCAQWNHALEALCDWAWSAMAGPVLGHAAGWELARPPRLVLVPTGNLGMVPWPAARTTGPDGTRHYAVEDAVFSYAASARQLMGAVRRPGRPWADSVLLIADTAGDLPMAAIEARELRRLFYPADLTDVDHDEALTLASALLAAGAAGVVGTRWPVDDLAAAELTVAFHHFLGREGARPADALRSAQLWMLDRGRRPLEDLPAELAVPATAGRLGRVRCWAAFAYQGT
jgi:hypothetical protein